MFTWPVELFGFFLPDESYCLVFVPLFCVILCGLVGTCGLNFIILTRILSSRVHFLQLRLVKCIFGLSNCIWKWTKHLFIGSDKVYFSFTCLCMYYALASKHTCIPIHAFFNFPSKEKIQTIDLGLDFQSLNQNVELPSFFFFFVHPWHLSHSKDHTLNFGLLSRRFYCTRHWTKCPVEWSMD